MSKTLRVDWEVADELYRRRRPRERNHNGVIRRALASGTFLNVTQQPPKGGDKGGAMNLMVCIDGVEAATVPLRDGDDAFNHEAERGALDRAYEFKETNPDSVVTIVVNTVDDEGPGEAADDGEFIADNLGYLASIDEGEHTNSDRLWALARALREGRLTLTGSASDEPTEA